MPSVGHGELEHHDDMNKESRNARARDNQRHARARKQERIAHLEDQVRRYEQRGIEASLAMQTRARQVEHENRKLRGLLAAVVNETDLAHCLTLPLDAGGPFLRHVLKRTPEPVPLPRLPAALPVVEPPTADLGAATFDPSEPDAAFGNFLNILGQASSEQACGKDLSAVGQQFCSLLTILAPSIYSEADKQCGKQMTCRETYKALQHVLADRLSVEEVVSKLMSSATLSSNEEEGSVVDSKAVGEILKSLGIGGEPIAQGMACC